VLENEASAFDGQNKFIEFVSADFDDNGRRFRLDIYKISRIFSISRFRIRSFNALRTDFLFTKSQDRSNFIYYHVNLIVSEYNWTSKGRTNSFTRVIQG